MHYLSLNYPADPAMQAKIDAAQAEIDHPGAAFAPSPAGKAAPAKGVTR